MVMLAFIGNAETDRHLVQEFRFRHCFPEGCEIVSRVKDQFVLTGAELVFRQQGLIATPILVGRCAAEMMEAVVDTVQINPHTGGRTPVGGIQYMRGKKSH